MPPTKAVANATPANTDAPQDDADWRQKRLLDRPGFLIRRLHQIHVALFMEECAGANVTPVQYSVLTVLEQFGDRDQALIARDVGMDRTNIADVLARLEERGLVARRVSEADKRMRTVRLTEAGDALVREMDEAAARAHARTVEALPPDERERLIVDLIKLVDANNEVGRAPLKLA